MHYIFGSIAHLVNVNLARKICFTLVLISSFLFSVQARAVGDSADTICNGTIAFTSRECWYVGGGVGQSHIAPNPVTMTNYRIEVSDDADTSGKGFVGVTFSEHWFSEFTYESLGAAELTYGPIDLSSTTIQNTTDYLAFSASMGYWLRGRTETWDGFIRAGYTRIDTDETVVDIEEDLLSVGLGIEWRFATQWFGRLEYTYYDQDATSLGLSVARYLGGSYKKTKKIMPKTVAPVEAFVEVEDEPELELVEVLADSDEDEDGVLFENDACPDSDVGAKVDSRGCPLLETITLNVQFDSNRALIKSEFTEEIERVSAVIKGFGHVHITVEGHTDWQGALDDNQVLSEQRATAVADELLDKTGLSMDDVTIVGHGELKPIADNKTVEGRYKNRRVMVIISEK